ncbi:hypothetical protein ABFW11_34215, partial [Mycolicibacterium porcinum]
MTNDVPAPQPSGPEADGAQSEPQPVTAPRSEPQRVWSMPKPAVTRKQADEVGRIAREACTAVIRFLADVARAVSRALRQLSGA